MVEAAAGPIIADVTKLLIIVLATVALVWLLKRALHGRPGAGEESPREREDRSRAKGDLVACAHCGVNLPATEALEAAGRHYCGEAHRRAGPRGR